VRTYYLPSLLLLLQAPNECYFLNFRWGSSTARMSGRTPASEYPRLLHAHSHATLHPSASHTHARRPKSCSRRLSVFDDRQPITGICRMMFDGLRRMQNLTVNAETTNYTGLVCRNSVLTSSLGGKYIAPYAWGLDREVYSSEERCRSRELCPPLYSLRDKES
jgi:hypothetical protein